MVIPRAPRILISVAEQSADEHAAALVGSFLKLVPDARFVGVAGPALQAAGCEVLDDFTGQSAMAAAAFKRIPSAWVLLGRVKRYLQANVLDAAVVVDSPALNLPIARLCKKGGLPVLYFIAPQTWAWGIRRLRNARLRRRADRVACLWPFEEPMFRAAGIAATCVGHPAFDALAALHITDKQVRGLRHDASPVITLLPGSRSHVVREVLPGQLEIVRALAVRFRRARFFVVGARQELLPLIDSMVSASYDRDAIQLVAGAKDRALAIRAADLCLVASGTVTLEVAYHGTPMIVMYNTSALLYGLVGRWLITTPFYSLPNILAGRKIVPEFMPTYRSTAPMIATAIEWLATPAKMDRVRGDLREMIAQVKRPGAADATAKILLDMLEQRGDAVQ